MDRWTMHEYAGKSMDEIGEPLFVSVQSNNYQAEENHDWKAEVVDDPDELKSNENIKIRKRKSISIAAKELDDPPDRNQIKDISL